MPPESAEPLHQADQAGDGGDARGNCGGNRLAMPMHGQDDRRQQADGRDDPRRRMHRGLVVRRADPQRLGRDRAGGHLLAGDPGDEHGHVVRPAAKVRQIDQRLGRLLRRQAGQDRADLGVFDAAGQAVAAQQIDVARRDRVRTFQIDLHVGIGAERPRDDVLGHDRGDVGPRRQLPRGLQLPLQAVVERELADRVAAEAIDAAVADVGRQRPLRQQHEDAAGRPHVVEVGVGGAAAIDLGVRLADRPLQGLRGGELAVLVIEVRHAVGGQLAGQLAGRVGAHAVGHHQQVPALGECLGRLGQQQRVRSWFVVRRMPTSVRAAVCKPFDAATTACLSRTAARPAAGSTNCRDVRSFVILSGF